MKKKKQHNGKTRVSFILDETGSMVVCKEATISGFNEYIMSLKKETKNLMFTLTKFNSSKVEIKHNDVPLSKVEKLTNDNYVPSQLTPLYDAIGKTIQGMENGFNGKTLMVIMTDGQENDSKEFDRKKVYDLVKNKQNDGWTFVFLGANIDSFAVGGSIGVPMGNTTNFVNDSAGMKTAMRGMAVSCSCYANTSINTSETNYFKKYDKKSKQKGGSYGKAK
jgi:hypothetical protein